MDRSVFLILSGTYVGPELESEYGLLPPCFLPNGSKRLFEDQITFGRSVADEVALVLPDDYDAPAEDIATLETAQVRVLRTDRGKTVSESLAGALRELDHVGRVLILFGDTLVDYGEGSSEPDTFASGRTRHLARWADYVHDGKNTTFRESIQADGERHGVVAGFFDFSDAARLRDLAERHQSIVDVLNDYSAVQLLVPMEATKWLDFGHLHTYYWSRRTELAARAFNQVEADGFIIRKTGTPARKIFAEAAWFENLPVRLRPFVPHLIDVHREPEVAYELEYLHLPILSELYCFASLPSPLWLNILSSCKEFLELCQAVRPAAFEITPNYHHRFFEDMFLGKTMQRLETFSRATDLSLEREWTFNSARTSSLRAVADDMIALIRPSTSDDICIWHGDFHFANIFFDFRSQRVRVVDPRGMLSDGTITMFGDARYDISKLVHSVVGMYDFIMAGRYTLGYNGGYSIELDFRRDAERSKLVEEFGRLKIGRYACVDSQMIAMVALLFLTMLPLHANNPERQFALLANGLRLADMAGRLA